MSRALPKVGCWITTLTLFAAALPGGAAAATGATAQQDEEILAYDVHVDVGAGGVLTVTESIEVRALGREIRRGIYRDFPTRFPRSGGGEVVAPFEVLAVTRDGESEPYAIERIMGTDGRGGVRVRIGDADVFLPHGVYRYELVYRTERWIAFGEPHDRFDWNVTGNGWAFPIRSASATIVLPTDVDGSAVDLEAWTGPDGSTAQDATWAWDAAANAATFRTTRPLGVREGLTIRVDAPAGVIPPPTADQEAAWSRLDWGGYVDTAAVVALILALYLFMWYRVGRDPRGGPVVVRYEPPQGFSPAALGFMRERGYEPAQVTAALVSLAVKGALTIEKVKRKWVLRATGDRPDGLSNDEGRLLDDLFGTSASVELGGSSNPRVRAAVKAFRTKLEHQIEKRYLVRNRNWFLAGAVASVAAFALLARRYRFEVGEEIWFIGLWLTFWSFGVGTLLYRVGHAWKQVLRGELLAVFGAIFLSLFAIPFLAAEVFVGYLLYRGAPHYLMVGALAIGLINVVFYHLLERPTLKGRGVLDELAGFRRFLGATDKDVFDRLQEPDRSLELFERFLPHAIALDVGNAWAERFERVLASADRDVATAGGSPSWYAGGRGGSDLSGMTSSLGGAFSSALSSSSAAPPSSGSGGGGGSSGGGGGGGGGGGW